MRYFLAFLLCLAGGATCASAQVVDTSVCDILSNPTAFDGKIVRIKGTAVAGFDEFFIKDSGCQGKGGVWLAYPERSDAKAGPVAILTLQLAKNNPASVQAPKRVPVQVDKNKDFKQFDSLLSAPYKGKGMCLGCVRNTVSATFVGRLDGSQVTGLERNDSGKVIAVHGFGNMNRYNARLVLQSVSGVTAQEIDYTAVLKSSPPAPQAGPEGLTSDHAKRAAEAFGEAGEENGVGVSFGIFNELLADDGGKGTNDSPDGVLFNCVFDMDRLKEAGLSSAMAHIGTHIADIRTRRKMNDFEAEYTAVKVGVLSAIVGANQKLYLLPGGFIGWNEAWPSADREKIMNGGISQYLTNWMLIAK